MFVIHLVAFITAFFVGAMMNNVGVLFGGLIGAGIGVGLFSYRYTKKLAFGLAWQNAGAAVCSVILGIGVGGIIPYVVLQMLAAQEIKKMGVKTSIFGFKKKDYKSTLEERRRYEASLATSAVTTPGFQTP